MRIAIVGTGVSGLVVAHHLHRDHDVTVFEADDRIGGHVNTVDVEVDGRRVAVDTGFIVCNERTYPNFLGLLDELGVPTQPSTMSFSVSDPAAGLEYRATNLASLFAQPGNVVRPRFLRMLRDIVRMNRVLRSIGPDEPDTLGQLVARHHASPGYVEDFLVPLGASIWSADPTTFLDVPAATYARFMGNHGLLDLPVRARWRTVVGGARTYVDALTAPFADRIRTSTPVRKVRRSDEGAELVTDDGIETFDRVVLATHADQALGLLADPTPDERAILGAVRHQPNVATLHCDERFLPSRPRARAAWNFHVGSGDGRQATLTYWMNLLQSIDVPTPLLVTLNRHDEIDPAKVFRRIEYRHPVLDGPAVAAQARRHEIQGVRGTYFAGAWWANGFHEDGVVSALDVVRSLAR
jgi:predicted NAD/FAD-binding protein